MAADSRSPVASASASIMAGYYAYRAVPVD